MGRTIFRPLLVAALVAVASGACDSGDTPITPTDPDPAPTISETFAGTVGQNGAVSFTFTTKAAGLATARLTVVNPDNTIAVGLSLGVWDGAACQIVISNDNATPGAVVAGNVGGAGTLCARIYDVGKIPAPNPYPFHLAFEFIVIHP